MKTFQINESKLQGFREMAYQLVQEVKTRWNSTFHMFQRYLLIWDHVNLVLEDQGKLELMVSKEDMAMVSYLTRVLAPIDQVTNTLSSDTEVKIGSVIPLYHALLQSLGKIKPTQEMVTDCIDQKKAERFRDVVITNLKEKFFATVNDPDIQCCTILDPQFKHLKFLTEQEKKKWYQNLKSVLATFENSKSRKTANDDRSSSISDQRSSDLLDILSGFQDVPVIEAKDELQEYLHSLATKEELSNSLIFWRNNHERFPNLSSLAKKFLCIQSSSASSERLWSDMGGIITKLRSRLDPETACMLMWLKENIELW